MKRLLVFSILIFMFTAITQAKGKTNTVRVPDVIGMKSSSAKLILEKAGLKTATTVVTKKGKPGTVVKLLIDRKEIKPWSLVSRGTTVFIGIVKEVLIPVPKVTGKSVTEAKKILKDLGLKSGSITKEATSEAEPGTIIRQKPKKGEDVKKGTKINLVTAKQPTVKVPDLLGMNLKNSKEIVNEKKLLLGKTTEEYSDSPPGTIIKQDPKPGLDVATSTVINVVIAKERIVSVPSLRGKTKSEATRLLDQSGLKLGTVEERIDDRVKVGNIISQSPYGYKKVTKGTPVNIVIAIKEMVTLPNIIGLKQRDATRILEQLGFRVTINTIETDQQPVGIVQKMNPSYGKFEKGKRVTLTISKPKPKPKPVSITTTVETPSKQVPENSEKSKYSTY